MIQYCDKCDFGFVRVRNYKYFNCFKCKNWYHYTLNDKSHRYSYKFSKNNKFYLFTTDSNKSVIYTTKKKPHFEKFNLIVIETNFINLTLNINENFKIFERLLNLSYLSQ